MKLHSEQSKFLSDFALLIHWLNNQGFEVTAGHLFRDQATQDILLEAGKSTLKTGMHQYRLAGDIFLFSEGHLLQERYQYNPAGKFWENLNAKNVWGGNYKSFIDAHHFERHIPHLVRSDPSVT